MEVKANINQGTRAQELIDAVALNLESNQGLYIGESPAELADLLDLCPEQDVWMYEPDTSNPESDMVFATFRLQASYGTTFHMSCALTDTGEVLEWIGPYDVTIKRLDQVQVYSGVAA